ncbi:MAG: hypothetical protein BWX70_03090 [Verrucomicrobia bacterium ADurb.Bin070]|nr:MAG: hypothetical protein BWX70_03090 [Verrucomicrobia bacterium ADurb.Bin070]
MQADRQDQPPARELDRAVVVHDIVPDLIDDARDRCAPRRALVGRKPQHRAAILLVVLAQIEERDRSALQAQQAHGHDVHAPLVRHDEPVLGCPGPTVVGRDPGGQAGRVMVPPGTRGVVCVDKEDTAVLQCDERALAVARVARVRGQLERPHGNLRHRGGLRSGGRRRIKLRIEPRVQRGLEGTIRPGRLGDPVEVMAPHSLPEQHHTFLLQQSQAGIRQSRIEPHGGPGGTGKRQGIVDQP